MSQFKKKLSLLLVLMLLLPATGLRAQGPFRDARTGTVGLRLDGGTSWSFGSSFENVGANQINLIQPYGAAGLLVNIKPWVRIGADYSYTRMIREQLFSTLEPLTGDGIVPGSVGGAVYRDFKTNFHGASLTGEFNLLEIGKPHNCGRLALWLGTGVGYMFANGNTFTFSVKDEMRTDNTQTIHFGGNNDPHKYNTLFIPATLNLEYAFLPEVALSLGGGFRYLPFKTDLAPRSQAYAKVGLVFNLVSKARRKAACCHKEMAPVRDTVYIDNYIEVPVEKVVEVQAEVPEIDLPYVTFVRGSSVLDEMVNAGPLATLLSYLKANPSVNFDIIGWTDHTSTDKINLPLSVARAKALREYLINHGIDASRILDIEGRGNYPISGEAAYSVIARRAEAVLKK